MQLCSNQDASFNFSHSAGFLHSRHAPQKEARRFADEICAQVNEELSKLDSIAREASLGSLRSLPSPQATLNVVVIGVGWGYLIEELAAINSHSQPTSKTERAVEFFFYEPIPEVYQTLKSQGRLKVLESLNAKLSKDLRALRQELQKKDKTQILFHISPSYRRLFPQLLSEVSNSFKQAGSIAEQIDQNTAKHFLRQWTRNAFRLTHTQRKLDFISGAPKLANSTHSQKKALVIYCGAAPGLLQDLKYLTPELLSKAFIIASDSALGPLLAKEYSVDLAICVDSGAASLHHLHAARRFSSSSLLKKNSKARLWKFPVLSWSGSLPGLASYFSKVYYYRSSLPFDQILGTGPLSTLTEWQNSSRNPLGLALYMAYLLGAEELYCAGTSFTAHRRQSHERGTGYQEYVLGRSKRTFSLEMYKSSAYQEEHSTRNHWAWQAALELASRLGLRLEKIRDLDPKAIQELCSKKDSSQSIAQDWEKQLSILSLSTSDIRSFLMKQQSPALLSQLEDWGLAAKLWSKYMQFCL